MDISLDENKMANYIRDLVVKSITAEVNPESYDMINSQKIGIPSGIMEDEQLDYNFLDNTSFYTYYNDFNNSLIDSVNRSLANKTTEYNKIINKYNSLSNYIKKSLNYGSLASYKKNIVKSEMENLIDNINAVIDFSSKKRQFQIFSLALKKVKEEIELGTFNKIDLKIRSKENYDLLKKLETEVEDLLNKASVEINPKLKIKRDEKLKSVFKKYIDIYSKLTPLLTDDEKNNLMDKFQRNRIIEYLTDIQPDFIDKLISSGMTIAPSLYAPSVVPSGFAPSGVPSGIPSGLPMIPEERKERSPPSNFFDYMDIVDRLKTTDLTLDDILSNDDFKNAEGVFDVNKAFGYLKNILSNLSITDFKNAGLDSKFASSGRIKDFEKLKTLLNSVFDNIKASGTSAVGEELNEGFIEDVEGKGKKKKMIHHKVFDLNKPSLPTDYEGYEDKLYKEYNKVAQELSGAGIGKDIVEFISKNLITPAVKGFYNFSKKADEKKKPKMKDDFDFIPAGKKKVKKMIKSKKTLKKRF